jgi:hypothetical protein
MVIEVFSRYLIGASIHQPRLHGKRMRTGEVVDLETSFFMMVFDVSARREARRSGHHTIPRGREPLRE